MTENKLPKAYDARLRCITSYMRLPVSVHGKRPKISKEENKRRHHSFACFSGTVGSK